MGSASLTTARCRMYAVAKGPTYLIQRSRRGLKSVYDEQRKSARSSASPPPTPLSQEQSCPPLVFHSRDERKGRSGKAGKREAEKSRKTSEEGRQREEEHRKIVSFLSQSWDQTRQEIDSDCSTVEVLQESDNPELQGFQPFDMDAWMEKRLFNAIMAGL